MLNTVKRWDIYCAIFTLWDIVWAVLSLTHGHIFGVFFFMAMAVVMIIMWHKARPNIAEQEARDKLTAERIKERKAEYEARMKEYLR